MTRGGDGRVVGSWAHLLPRTHQGCLHSEQLTVCEIDQNISRTALPQLKTGRKRCSEKRRRGRGVVWSGINSPPQSWDPQAGSMSQVWGSSMWKQFHDLHQGLPPRGSAPGRGAPIKPGFANQPGLTPRKMGGYRKLRPSLKGPEYNLTCSKIQHRGSSLKSAWAIHAGDLLARFKVCAGGAVIRRNFLWERKFWWAPFSCPPSV